MCLTSVVLPLPRNPVIRVTGNRASDEHGVSDLFMRTPGLERGRRDWRLAYRSGVVPARGSPKFALRILGTPKAGTHAPCPLDSVRCVGPGSRFARPGRRDSIDSNSALPRRRTAGIERVFGADGGLAHGVAERVGERMQGAPAGAVAGDDVRNAKRP